MNNLLLIITFLAAVMAGISTLLLGISLPRELRRRWLWLRFVEGRKLHLIMMAVLGVVVAEGANLYRGILSEDLVSESATVSSVQSPLHTKLLKTPLLGETHEDTIAFVCQYTHVETREARGSDREVVLTGYAFAECLKGSGIGGSVGMMARVAENTSLWENPWGWHRDFGLEYKGANYRLARLFRGATIELIGPDGPDLPIRKVRVRGWLSANAIGTNVEFQKRVQGEIGEWMTDGNIAVRVSSVRRWFRGGYVASVQFKNPRPESVSINEVSSRWFDQYGHSEGVRQTNVAAGQEELPTQLSTVAMEFIGAQGMFFGTPEGMEITVYLNNSVRCGPFMVTWKKDDLEGYLDRCE